MPNNVVYYIYKLTSLTDIFLIRNNAKIKIYLYIIFSNLYTILLHFSIFKMLLLFLLFLFLLFLCVAVVVKERGIHQTRSGKPGLKACNAQMLIRNDTFRCYEIFVKIKSFIFEKPAKMSFQICLFVCTG